MTYDARPAAAENARRPLNHLRSAIADGRLLSGIKRRLGAKKLPSGPELRKLLKEAGSYGVLAKVKGWLSGELRPPD
jgi:hypothetical protein